MPRATSTFWLDLFYGEFFAPRAAVLGCHVDAFLDYFERIGGIERRDGAARSHREGPPYFAFLAEQTRGLLEAYYATLSARSSPPRARSRASSSRSGAGEQFERAELLGEVRRREGENPVTFGNALDLLTRRGVLGGAAGRATATRATCAARPSTSSRRCASVWRLPCASR